MRERPNPVKEKPMARLLPQISCGKSLFFEAFGFSLLSMVRLQSK